MGRDGHGDGRVGRERVVVVVTVALEGWAGVVLAVSDIVLRVDS